MPGLSQQHSLTQRPEAIPLTVQQAIKAAKLFEEQLVDGALEPELSDAGVSEEMDDELSAEGGQDDHGEEPDQHLPAEDLSGHLADAHSTEVCEEPPEREDFADSDGSLSDGDAENPFEQAETRPAPLVAELPRSARPIVRFAIDGEGNVHALDAAEDPLFELRRTLASAVARHLQRHGISLREAGDWCQIPAIGGDDELLRLVAADEDQGKVNELVQLRKAARRKAATKMDKQGLAALIATLPCPLREFCEKLPKGGAGLKGMAIRLPNEDVVKVAALITTAQKGKAATRAAALRAGVSCPSILAEEEWKPGDWKRFERTQRQNKTPS